MFTTVTPVGIEALGKAEEGYCEGPSNCREEGSGELREVPQRWEPQVFHSG